jgi:hypothetical protein
MTKFVAFLTASLMAVFGLAGCSAAEPEAVPASKPDKQESRVAESPKQKETPKQDETAEQDETVEQDKTVEQADALEQTYAIESFVEHAQSEMPNFLAESQGAFSDAQVRYVPLDDVLEFSFELSAPLVPDEVRSGFDEKAQSLQSDFDEVFSDMEEMGLPSALMIRVVYLNPDGSEIWSRTFERS